MVSKRTGRPRGRPRKLRPHPRPPHRPRLPFLCDPDRYLIALIDALLELDAIHRTKDASRVTLSLRTCSLEVAKWDVGVEAGPPRPSRRPGLFILDWLSHTRRGARAGTFAGRAATIRKKYRGSRKPKELIWRFTMKQCWMVVLVAPAGSIAARAEVLEFAQIIGEADYARRVLIPMIEYKQASPDFLGTLRSTLNAE